MKVQGEAWRFWPWALLAASWFLFGALRPLLDPDEGRYAEIPREMLATGDWITPQLNGFVYLEKPPLQYWATAAAYSLFGFSELSARAYALCLALLAVLAVAVMGGRYAAVVLATSPYFLLVGQLNLLDGAFATLLAGAIFAFIAAQRATGADRARALTLLAWGLLALAVLQKGIVAPLLAAATLAAYSAITRDFSVWRRLRLVGGSLLFTGITAGWFVLVSARNPDFLRFFFIHEHFARFLTTVHQRVEPWWFFAPIFVVGVLPWVGRLPRAVRAAWREEPGAHGFRPMLFLLVWCVVVLLFFSVSGSKLAPYVLPAMPALAVLIAPTLAGSPQSLRNGTLIGAISVLVTAAGLLVAGRLRGAGTGGIPFPLALWSGVAAAVAIAALVPALLRRKTRDHAPLWPLAVSCAALAWPALLTAYTALPPLRTAKPLVERVRTQVHPGTALFSVGQYRQTIPPYLGRTLRIACFEGELVERRPDADRIGDLAGFAEVWRAQTDAVAFIDPDVYAQLAARGLPGRVLAEDGRTIAVARR